MTLPLIVALPFIAGAILLGIANGARYLAASLAFLFTLAAGVLLALQVPSIAAGAVLSEGWDWLPLPGARFGFRLDGLAAMFAGMVLALGALIILYARYYLSGRDPIARFYAFFMLFMGSMLGVVLADNLILLAVFWELTSLSSFLLIGYWQYRSDARQGARLALTVTGLGGLALLAGLLIIGQIVGDYSLDAVLAAGDQIRANSLYIPALLLVLLGVFTKSAQFPFHFWLPHAMAAPTPVSAYLHSATMVKAGVFLLARFYPALAGTEAWFFIVSAAGLLTLLVGAYTAVFQHDLKGLLAYSTISHLGLITLLFGLNSPMAAVAGIFHILNHATFKASLFMAAGIIDHESGSRDMRKLNGLWRLMPITAVLAIVASAAMAGVPLLNGFLSKELFFGETLALEGHTALEFAVPALATLAAAFSVTYSMRFIHDVFWNGEPHGLPRQPHDPPKWMLVPVAVLVFICLLVGIVPNATIEPILALSAAAVLGGPLPEFTIKLWHGFNLPLAMSIAALVAGTGFYLALQRLYSLHEIVHLPRGGKEIYDAALGRALALTRGITGRLQSGHLQRSLVIIFLFATLAAFLPFLSTPLSFGSLPLTPVSLPAVLIWSVGCTAVVSMAFLHAKRLIALVTIGVVGLIVSLAFATLSAPDLALTQLLVEFVTVILMLLALYYLPFESPPERNSPPRWRDASVAAIAGTGVAALTYAMLTRPSASIAEYFLAKSLPEGFGTNVVNVILVDFRALDTLGEVTVVAIAALIVTGLLRTIVPRVVPEQPEAGTYAPVSLFLEFIARVLLPLAILVSFYMFLRGHNLPGGGFIAGLILAIALLLPYLASGSKVVESRMPLNYQTILGVGLVIAALTGAGSFLFGHPFLTSSYWSPAVPILGKIPLATAMIFDLGVYLTVAGGVMLALVRLGKMHAPSREGT
ncbi:MAG TPA: monovalent cation/H+ antiporter subunit A [Steroidobacteraceae bacterium]|nr:monovalent cation/H+ antiporter subunit A [Steroidobacteraceae bacterium]